MRTPMNEEKTDGLRVKDVTYVKMERPSSLSVLVVVTVAASGFLCSTLYFRSSTKGCKDVKLLLQLKAHFKSNQVYDNFLC